MVYLWQVRILRLAWLQHAAAWAGIPVLYSSEEPAYNLVPQVGQPRLLLADHDDRMSQPG